MYPICRNAKAQIIPSFHSRFDAAVIGRRERVGYTMAGKACAAV
jgi:hypothetical protein